MHPLLAPSGALIRPPVDPGGRRGGAQNNVLELWSLFDFLMPGFLGSEREFYALYGKALEQGSSSGAASRHQEAGMLALDALHKKVRLPFDAPFSPGPCLREKLEHSSLSIYDGSMRIHLL